MPLYNILQDRKLNRAPIIKSRNKEIVLIKCGLIFSAAYNNAG